MGKDIVKKEFEAKYKVGKRLKKSKNTFSAKVKQTGKPVVVQFFNKTALLKEHRDIEAEIKLREAASKVPGVLKLLETFETAKEWILVEELAVGGTLLDRILEMKAGKLQVEESEAATVLYQLLMTLKQCHEQNLVHGNLHPANVVFVSAGMESEVKIRGFRGAEGLSESALFYVAPESMMKDSQANGAARDMWSLGVVAFQFLSGGTLPFLDNNVKQLVEKITRGRFKFDKRQWSDISIEAKEFVRMLLRVNVSDRLTAEEALDMKWMKEAAKNATFFAKIQDKSESEAAALLRQGLNAMKAISNLQANLNKNNM